MKTKYVRLCGIAAMLLALPAFAQTPIVLDLPCDWQVIQRNAQDWAEIKVAGTAPAEATVVEAKAELGAGMRGKAMAWSVVAKGAQIKDGKFSGSLKLMAGGWYALNVRFRKSAADPEVLGEAAIEHVGVGDIFVVAGQSNASNHGAEQQKTTTGMVAASDGKKWQLANDPQPGASGGQGSFQPPFGDAMVARFTVPVGIIACGIGATSVREWLPKGATFPNPPTLEGRVRQLPSGEWECKGEAFDMLTGRMKQLGPKGFRAVLWHQGESDAGQPDPKRTLIGKPYRVYLEQLIKESRKAIGWDAPWFVALVSSHGGDGVPEMRDAQKSLWTDGIALEGPDSDALKGDLRDGVHFSGKGLREHGKCWADKVAPWLEKQIVSGAVLKALLVTGYDPHGHKWEETTSILKSVLQHGGKFDVDIATLSTAQEAQAFAPDFGKYNVVVLDAHGRDWSAATQEPFERYVNGGGGLVVVHNAVGQFAAWDAYRAMIGIGPGGQQDGVGFKFDESTQSVVQIPPGEGVKQNGHGSQHEWVVKSRESEHPIMAGLPQTWLHTADELYHGFRGKPESIRNVKVLATALSAKETGGTGNHEPVVVVNRFGKGRIFHLMLGHSAGAMSCVGFQTVFLRGTEWAATGKVTLTDVPADFPSAGKSSARPADNKSSSRKIVFIGGADTHGPGAHAHKAGATLLKQWVDTSEDFRGVATALYLDRLPDDLAELDAAAAIVLMWEGWDQHLFQAKNIAVMNKFGQLMQRGVGLMCLHAATAVGDDAEKEFLKWSGGNKKLGYSSHPMENDLGLSIVTPEHSICRGVKPMRFAREEFYRRILFDESAGKVTPILTASSPVGKPADQVVAWAFERTGGGRTFSCTGPHFHDSFQDDDFRRLIMNAIRWIANKEHSNE